MDPQAYHILTLGCQMNQRDSETIAGILDGLGFHRAENAEQAHILVINTCSVRAKPEQKAFSRLGEWRLLKQQAPERIIAVCGCTSQVATEEVRRRVPDADIIIGPRSLGNFREALLQRLEANGDGPAVFADSAEVIPEALPVHRARGISAFVNITYGCDNYCAYCVVPYARGREISRIPPEIVTECREALAHGYREITLLGQNVNSYGHDLHPPMEFAELLLQVGTIRGLERLRFTTSHPKDLCDRVLETMATVPTICEHLHLPLQAADDEVLARMGRGYTFQQFHHIITGAREAMPAISITTDLMVGFPGETEAQFQNTLRAVAQIRFDQAFMFKYNDRPGTRAAQMPDKVPEEEKQRRLLELVNLQNQIARDVNQATVGKVFEVLVEGPDPKSPGSIRGRSRQNKIVIFPGSGGLAGRVVKVRATEGFLWGHKGELLRTVK